MSLYQKKSLNKLNETELYANSIVFKTYIMRKIFSLNLLHYQ
jgi:hypothetical protein